MPRSQSRLLAGLTPTEPWRPQAGLVLSAQLASLVATGWIVWSVAASSRPHKQSLAGVVTESAADALLALVCAGAIMTAFQLVSARSMGADALRISLRTARTSIWLAPTAILLSRLSPLAVGAALALVIDITQMLYSQWAELESVAGTPPAGSYTWLRASACAVALGGQTTIVCLWMGAPVLAATLLCFSAAGLTLLCMAADAYRSREPSNLPDSLLRILLTLILAQGLTVSGRLLSLDSGAQATGEADPQVRRSPLGSARALIRKLSEPNRDQQDASRKPNKVITTLYQPSAGIEITDKSYQGVILWPQVRETQRVRVVPSPARLSSPLLPALAPTPLRIPFSGQYWMFKPPLAAPPRGSFFRRSSPLDLSFLTTDHEPMSMKALQKLDPPLHLACCRAIQLSISNADRFPGTVALEVLLIDTQSPVQLVQSLGRRDVLSRPNVKGLNLAVLPVTEVLEFPVPRSARIRKFDVIQVLFHRALFRSNRSARISLEHFILVP